jgi:hypothetical protein
VQKETKLIVFQYDGKLVKMEELKDYLKIEAEKFIKARKKSAEKNPERKVGLN